MASPCRALGCSGLVKSRQQLGYCDKHESLRKKGGWTRQDEAGSTTKRGYGYAWRLLRDVVLRRDGHLCQECKRNGLITVGNHVDHIIGKASGGTDDLSNLQVLCAPCHMKKTGKES